MRYKKYYDNCHIVIYLCIFGQAIGQRIENGTTPLGVQKFNLLAEYCKYLHPFLYFEL